ncbi:MAG: prolyl aminopeptidase [Sedimentisphaerales bacterium]|nr:prolyl aminopeptidase [Sedimentisphaerales bacterium]
MREKLPCVILLSLSLWCSTRAGEVALWPEIEPFHSDYLKVSEIHKIHYELCGNRTGKPVFVLHGGPGGSCSPYMRRFFNPDKFLIVLHDQRGAGKSTPFAEIKENTTQHLVQDVERLRRHLKLDRIILFGGSWGSTLALAYGQAYPDHVSGMVLRGVFTATREEIDHFYHGGVATFFPEVYDRFVTGLPDPNRGPIPEYLFSLIENSDPEQRAKYSRLWAAYELRICGLDISDQKVNDALGTMNPYAFARLENYYMANGCFLEEGQLFRNAAKLEHIPIVMVNGRYDVICPPITAFRLKQKLPHARLILAESAGHWMGEKPVERELLQAMRHFE